ncbi:AmmeMemoRadiSam system radical SAM enzyme [Thermogymnomonas acidicola]|uniref:AmmeMemoRadiSam system radical SAM enzyme n=1 Tax=Thermogymnomonas acidicola TaxID=399579 RepID=A0AA37BPA9_9ARCH|nr:AmmeMemoRadiSam system radical SAM enzyme [Thermogymnomonas acidicola]GGM66110.1 AmmeMemoRadiSam system radical SAM enzyme [Thermogymnomonas acidicola]
MQGEAVLYEKVGGKVRCTACRRYCTLADGQIGFCGVRQNMGGRLYLNVYGRPMAVQIDPIEKKPVLHMHPGYRILSIGTAGCDFACQFCQNFELSQRRRPEGYDMGPEDIVSEAISYGCGGIAYTYNEPTIFSEFARDVGVLARREGLINIFVTNGFETRESVGFISGFLDAATVDFKGNASKEFYRKVMSVFDVDLIYDTIAEMLAGGIHVEVTDLVVPRIGDSLDEARAMLGRIMDICGPDVPISFLRFHPDYRLMSLPNTPVGVLERHAELAKSMGFHYVYIGNVPGHRLQNTYCPGCGSLLVERDMMRTLRIRLTPDSRCPDCGYSIPFVL